MKIVFDHLAVLCLNLEASAKMLSLLGLPVNEIESFPAEGTKEVYIGNSNDLGRLLLLEAISEGVYQSALKKRGPGIHHLAIGVENLLEFLEKISKSGWFLHPSSVKSIEDKATAWLVRPKMPLIEVFELKIKSAKKSLLINEIFLSEELFSDKLYAELDLKCIRKSSEKNSVVVIGNKRLNLNELARKN